MNKINEPYATQWEIGNNLKLELNELNGMVRKMASETTRVEIKVDGKAISMNRFVQKIIWNILVGMLDSLREVDNWKEVTIALRRS